jgi:hypothetical protein
MKNTFLHRQGFTSVEPGPGPARAARPTSVESEWKERAAPSSSAGLCSRSVPNAFCVTDKRHMSNRWPRRPCSPPSSVGATGIQKLSEARFEKINNLFARRIHDLTKVEDNRDHACVSLGPSQPRTNSAVGANCADLRSRSRSQSPTLGMSGRRGCVGL